MMKLIATIPSPHVTQMYKIVMNTQVNAVRFNTGVRTPYTPKNTLERIIECLGEKKLWVDLKCRQLRIVKWAEPTYGDIELNHEVSVDLPATIVFRDGSKSEIREINGIKIFVDPPPQHAVGAGQAVNIIGNNLCIKGFFTDEDCEYIEVAKELGLHDYMLSFVQNQCDIDVLHARDKDAQVIAKIESCAGLQFVQNIDAVQKTGLMAARDDLYINIGSNKWNILDALQMIIAKDSNAIVASRILTSFVSSGDVSIGDLSDLYLMYSFGYRTIMLSDSLCFSETAFNKAIDVYKQFLRFIAREVNA
ncbi:MAG: pyruvate kinase [Candidatus Moraniibacteriota bacterium]|jgi:pyruvate kinase